ncbi:MAG TPA: hypothetical protein VHT05_01465 [Candidatus Elarobacter sp.]|jgi:hypothetical protein|nr:hypothetical protein [Candidatus Elarobacter sp.]
MMRNVKANGIAIGMALLVAAAPHVAAASGVQGSAQINYKILPSVKAQVVPNYQSGFGPQGGLGSGSTPAAGPSAVLDGGTVDFGNVVVGYEYLYKYAAQVSVQTNDAAGFVVYGEGATDLNGSNPVPAPSTWPLQSTLFWLVSNAANTAFSPATSFNKTTGTPIGANGAGGINYGGGAPSSGSAIWTYSGAGSVSQGYDYELRLSGTIPVSQFNVYIVYTVVGN